MATSPLRRGLVPALLLVALAAAVGCAGRRPIATPTLQDLEHTWRNQTQPTPDAYPNPDETVVRGLADALGADPGPVPPQPAPAGRPLQVLALSGGGKYGAFSTGVLAGWQANGTRPTFDVVTGISTGAIMSAFVFLGPQYDARVAEYFTTLRSRDLFRIRPARELAHHSSLASSDPLRRIIEREVTDQVMCELRQAHGEGRRVFVGTNNLMTHRLTVWDLGAIAASGRPDAKHLVQQVILAACSAPGFVPPVEFDVTVNGVHYHELHGDAGNLVQALVCTGNGLPPGSDVYVLTAGYLYAPPRTERPGFLSLASRGVSDSLDALFRADLRNVYALCAVSHARFHMLAMPTTLTITPGSMSFDPEESQMMYRTGYQMGLAGPVWRVTPPATLPGEPSVPRAGLDFVTAP